MDVDRAEPVAGADARSEFSARAAARRGLWRILLGAVVLVLLVLVWPVVRANLQAICVLREVGGQKPLRAAVWLVSTPIERRDVSFTGGTGANAQVIRARIYRPVGRANPPRMVILHGVHYLGMNEPRLMGFAAAMAECGIEVLTPELPDIKDYHVGASSVETIGDSARWLAEGADEPRQPVRPVGVMGLSFSGGLALIAAAEPQYRPYFGFVLTVGAHDSMERVAAYYRTGTDVRPDGSVERLPAHEYGPLVLEYEYLNDFVPAADLAAVRAVLRAHLYEDAAGEKLAAAALNDEERSETKELMDTGSAVTKTRIAAVLAKHTAEMDAVSPAESLAQVKAPVYLLHGEGDNVIPAAETLWLARGLPAKDVKEVLVTPVLSHVNLDEPSTSFGDEMRLVHFFAGVLEAEERG